MPASPAAFVRGRRGVVGRVGSDPPPQADRVTPYRSTRPDPADLFEPKEADLAANFDPDDVKLALVRDAFLDTLRAHRYHNGGAMPGESKLREMAQTAAARTFPDASVRQTDHLADRLAESLASR